MSACPADEKLHGFLQGGLAAEEQQQMDTHLEACASCQKRLELLVHSRPLGPAGPWGSTSLHVGNVTPPLPADLPVVTEQRPEQIGGYAIEGELGRGGMGVVLRARDPKFHRPLAIKLLLSKYQGQDQLKQRFLEEAQIMGQLQHPGIPPVHDLGQLPDGRPFLVMKLIKGQTLEELLRQQPGTTNEPAAESSSTLASRAQGLPRWLAIFEHVCQTIAYAHARGIIHRDLKPGNVMVGAFGEVQVMDWGLAKLVLPATGNSLVEESPPSSTVCTLRASEPEAATQPGTALGTPAYMAPEQARGEVEHLDQRCDVFGLGAVLCEILTGKPAFAAGTAIGSHRLAMKGDLSGALVRLGDCAADQELIDLVKRCLALEKENRPRDGGAVAQAVAAYQAAVQERLREAELAEVAARAKAAEERKRRRVIMALAAAVLLLVVGASAAGVWHQLEQARLAQQQAKLDQDELRRQLEFAERKRILNQQVATTLVQAETARQNLHNQLGDPTKVHVLLCDLKRWAGLLTTVQAAGKQARAVADSGRDLLGPDEAARLQQLEQNARADTMYYQVAQELERIRIHAPATGTEQGEDWLAGPEYEKVLQGLGLDLRRGSVPELAKQIKQSPLRFVLVACLDQWALMATDKELRARLLQVARQADPDPWRDQVRDPKNWQDSSAVERLTAEVDVGSQSPQILIILAIHLKKNKRDPVPLLQKAIWVYPQDF
jgi:serine/threonine-protein kinase